MGASSDRVNLSTLPPSLSPLFGWQVYDAHYHEGGISPRLLQLLVVGLGLAPSDVSASVGALLSALPEVNDADGTAQVCAVVGDGGG